MIEVEAESFTSKDLKNFKRDFYIYSENSQAAISPDPDEPHLDGASGGAYFEILPDTRVTHDDKLIRKSVHANFYPVAGAGPEVTYPINVVKAGRYYIWMRAYSTGSEDNGAHIGLNGEWPATAQRIQWCKGKRQWTWSNGQRTEADHCGGAARIYIEIPTTGEHTLNVAAREDGFELDKIVLTTDAEFVPGEAP